MLILPIPDIPLRLRWYAHTPHDRQVYCSRRPGADDTRRIGVLWSGEHLFPGIPQTIDMLRKRGRQSINHSLVRSQLADRWCLTDRQTARLRHQQQHQVPRRLQEEIRQDGYRGEGGAFLSITPFTKIALTHIISPKQQEVFGSSYSAAVYIARIMALPAPKNKVFVLGESGVEAELAAESVPYIGGTDAALRRDMQPEDYTAIAAGAPSHIDPDVGVVLTGLDFHPTYLKYALAMAYLRNGAKFLATNIDSSLPNAGSLFPGAGATSAPLVKASGQEPLALGKPSQAMMDAIEGKFRFDRKKACMIGDRLNTDIQFGIEGGLGGTLCVLTGVSTKEEFLEAGAKVVPSAYVEKLSDLLG